MRDDLRIMAGAGGTQLINAAGTYTTAGGTLINGVYAIQIVSGGTAITALQTKPKNGDAAALAAVHNIVNVSLTDINGELITFKDPVSSITVAASSVLIAYAG
jgi:hypothetical protein